jgi:transcriptional regulator with XRE-family HTH domain
LPPVETLRSRIRQAIKSRGRTQKEVAEAIGVSQNTMSNLISGKTLDIGTSLVYAIAQELDVSTDYLFGIRDQMNRPGTPHDTRAEAHTHARTPAKAPKG